LAALGVAAGALALAARPGIRGAGRMPPYFAPAEKTLAWASPAVLGTSPRRRFYAGTNIEHAVTVEDLRAMAHRRLPGFVLEYLEAGGEEEAALARNIAALYVFGPPGVRETLIERARNAGCEALIVTVDAQIYGNREWHKRTTAGPKSLSWSSKFDALMHPRWFASGILTHGIPRFENVIEF